MSRIFLSHSSANNAEAIAVRDWLIEQGWNELFLDLDPERGLKAGQRWQEALKQAAERCEVVIFLISPAWAESKWCLAEFLLAKQIGKPIFGVIVEPTPFADIPTEMTAEWQLVDLTAGARDQQRSVTLPRNAGTAIVAYAADGLSRLRIGLIQSGLDPKYFKWPPDHDPQRAPYRGLRPLDTDDTGIFFGRDGPTVVGLDTLRALREAAPPRLLVILGASGAGKSSFMRAGLLPRLAREDQHFLPLPVVRPEHAALTGETGLIVSLEQALQAVKVIRTRAVIRAEVEAGATGVRRLLLALAEAKQRQFGDGIGKAPTIILPIDQAEELFAVDGAKEAAPFLHLISGLAAEDGPAVLVLFTIRSDNYEPLQTAPALTGHRQHMLSLAPMPHGAYANVIEGPAQRLHGTPRALVVEEPLVQALLDDIEQGGAKDALPLLAFTLERLYLEFHGAGRLTVEQYKHLGGITGSIEAAVKHAFAAADKDNRIPRDSDARLILLRRGLIPWLAGIDPDTKAPRRRVARLSEIPAEARPLINLLVEQRLLSTDVAKDTGETTIEPAHEALLRQWGLLQGWLSDDTGLLTVLDGIKRAARDWAANGKATSWLAHSTDRLRAAERLMARPDLAANLEPTDEDYVKACKRLEGHESSRARRQRLLIAGFAASALGIAGLAYAGALDPNYLEGIYNGIRSRHNDAYLKPGTITRDCTSFACPEMVMVAAGEYEMGGGSFGPIRKVAIIQPILISKFEVTFTEWDACVSAGGCSYRPDDENNGRGRHPVSNVSWRDVQQYLRWISTKTGRTHRLLSEAEWEFAARAGTRTNYHWGDDIGRANANCNGCQSEWDWKPAQVGSFPPNQWGLHDMLGNVYEWVEDAWRDDYQDAPSNGSARIDATSRFKVLRGGSWGAPKEDLKVTSRLKDDQDVRVANYGFRIARSIR